MKCPPMVAASCGQLEALKALTVMHDDNVDNGDDDHDMEHLFNYLSYIHTVPLSLICVQANLQVGNECTVL